MNNRTCWKTRLHTESTWGEKQQKQVHIPDRDMDGHDGKTEMKILYFNAFAFAHKTIKFSLKSIAFPQGTLHSLAKYFNFLAK